MSQHKIRRFIKHGMLPQLCVFEAVARLGNYTRAGEELFMAQPTVSVHIKKLTDTIGAPLIEQVGRRLYLTEVGTTLYAACREMFGTLDNLAGSLASLSDLETGRLQLAVSTTAKHFAPRLLVEFAQSFPKLNVSLQIHNRQTLIERLAANKDDLYIFATPPSPEEYAVVTQRILPNPLVALAPKDHPLAGKKKIPFATFAEQPFLMREPGSGTRMIAMDCFASHGLQPDVRMELSTNEAIREAIALGLGVSIMSRYTLEQGAKPDNLAILDVEGMPIEKDWVFAYPVDKQLPAAAASFMDFTRKASKTLSLSYLPIPQISGRAAAQPTVIKTDAAGSIENA